MQLQATLGLRLPLLLSPLPIWPPERSIITAGIDSGFLVIQARARHTFRTCGDMDFAGDKTAVVVVQDLAYELHQQVCWLLQLQACM